MNIDVTISIHALLAESDYSMGRNEKSFRGYFYPRSPCGERLRGWTLNINGPIFLSTLSLRRATPTQQRKTKTNEFLSTLSLRRATAAAQGCSAGQDHFYPRSPCGERPREHPKTSAILHFYPRSPCGERRRELGRNNGEIEFLSTLSLRRATCHWLIHHPLDYQFLSTLSLRRATMCHRVDTEKVCISIHALLAESDYIRSNMPNFTGISIHALLAESDWDLTGGLNCDAYFYPRSPCGERPAA